MLLLYDVTTLHFEISKEDEYRKSGFSKERRLEPQIIIGLLVDKKGFPLSINSFEGNKAETKTIIQVLKRFKEENKIKGITEVADAGMLSANNLELLEDEGYKFIVGSRISKIPYESVGNVWNVRAKCASLRLFGAASSILGGASQYAATKYQRQSLTAGSSVSSFSANSRYKLINGKIAYV
jgi:hypothetical protein